MRKYEYVYKYWHKRFWDVLKDEVMTMKAMSSVLVDG
jgi:hypothetical protein